MMAARVLQRRIAIICLLVMIWGKLFSAASAYPMCPKESVNDSIVRFLDPICFLDSSDDSDSPGFISVIEGDDVSLQKALDTNNKNGHGYFAVLFYASWCPFSSSFRPIFSFLSSLYPSIPHMAIEESLIPPRVLSMYGIHGFPALIIMNLKSTKIFRYRGSLSNSRTFGDLVDFYTDISGVKAVPLVDRSPEKTLLLSNLDKNVAKSSPSIRSRSPEKLLRQEKYLAMATAFVFARLIFAILPPLLAIVQFAWLRCMQKLRLESLLEHPRAYLNGVIHLFNFLKEPWRKRNLQGGAINARAWASKSLATVSIGDASTSRGA